jgi:N6-L-threonylcarbamoyladenine synthase
MKPLLAIETSCDECSAAVVEAAPTHGRARVLSHGMYSQIELHRPYGGIVPEVASRNHLEMINPVISEALSQAGLTFQDLGAIAVTNRPGLIGALLVGVSAAKALAYALQIPLIAVDHLEGHLHSLFIEGQERCPQLTEASLPLLVCLASGGHTSLYLIEQLPPQPLAARKIAESRDDAAGEAFDKCAKLMGLPYPGGKYIDELARTGNRKAFNFPRPMKGSLDFSFSGLKTSVGQQLVKLGFEPHVFGEIKTDKCPQGQQLHDLCASLQEAIVDVLVSRIALAADQNGVRSVAVVGGVSANSRFRAALAHAVHVPVLYPDAQYCTDNAAMIGAAALFQQTRGDLLTGDALLKLNASSSSTTGEAAL